MCLIIVKKELWIAVIKNFQNGTFEKLTITVTEVAFIQAFFLTVSSKQKNKNGNKKHDDTFIPSKS